MFNVERGEKLLKKLHDEIVAREDVDLWYSDGFYDVAGCWAHAADSLFGEMNDEDLTDIMAALTLCSPSDTAVSEVFSGGCTGYWLGNFLDWLHTSDE